ncbi:cobyrinate a,c-diamide synthase [Eubacterium multiforme]|uniref:Cobyrinic acid a,c-diamide synthase n=1 Tax=Eubacterium multiforme TaxID=83339 RepID=A0ABT9UVN1_9FIRM|nr:cobyrinate a,c-diamide synthase [Eubacterium multiforme]MDQ0150381.1 cobyrinic acid a,c-diamide synthase [Eubacterium multiforme]
MKSLIIASNRSGGGKTTFTLALMNSLIKKGFDVQGFKVGPDYIDGAFHKFITGKPSRNLDIFLMGNDGVEHTYSKGKGDLGVIEGVMGLYDGKGIDTFGSTYHVSKELNDMPILLVITPGAQSVTLCAELNGLINFKKANIVGVVLNSISESYYTLLKAAIEKNCNLKVFGFIPKDENLNLKSRHLGLVQSVEVDNLREKINYASKLLEENINLNGLIDEFKEYKAKGMNYNLKNKGIKIGVAKDKAFSFYYEENLELLKEVGEITYFSPLKDKELPKNLDFLYFGGGYPEIFKEELSKNESMRKSIKTALDNGMGCFGECGGLMYLTENIEGYDMVGFFKGNSEMTKRLQRFGYAKVTLCNEEACYSINCHEFHKSKVNLEENKVYKVEKENYLGNKSEWSCGYKKNNVIAGYPHVNFLGNIEFFKEVIGYKNY